MLDTTELLTPTQVRARLQCGKTAFHKRRTDPDFPPEIRFSDRMIRYRKVDLEAYIAARAS